MTEDFKDVSGLLEEDRSKIDDKVTIGDKIDIVKPIKPIRAPKFAAMRSMAEYPIPTPVTRKEMFLNVIAGGISELPTPKTREELYLAKICGMDVEIPIPLSRYEMYLYALSGGEWEVPEPVTRLEIFLYHNLGFEVETPEPVTREEIYWNGGQPQPTTIEGIPPLTFTAKRTGNLEDYTIYGNTVQNGTPTPDSPIEPEFVGERTENLFTSAQRGYILLNGRISNANGLGWTTDYINVANIETVTLAQDRLGISGEYYLTIASWDENKEFISNSRVMSWVRSTAPSDRPEVSKTLEPNAKYIRASIMVNESEDSFETVHPMLNFGSTALPYEPYGYKITISSAGQTKNIYLGQVPTTRKIKKLVLTGEEDIRFTPASSSEFRNVFYFYGRLLEPYTGITAIGTHFENFDGYYAAIPYRMPNNNFGLRGYGPVAWYFSVASNDFNSLEEFVTYIKEQYDNGTPFTIWYVLAEPETAVVNEPLCRIGDYADSVDFSQAGVEIPVTAGENTLSVGTTVQPSNMSITYK